MLAQAWLLGAQALENDRPGIKPKIRLGLAWLWPKPGPGTYIMTILCSPQCKIQISIYFSLKYLSLSDATVLTFLSPMCMVIAGPLFLGEDFTLQDVFAGCSK